MSNNEKIEELKQLKKEIIEFIQYPYYFTNGGNRYHFKETEGTPVVASEVQKQENGKVKVLSKNTNSDCVNGVCPIR